MAPGAQFRDQMVLSVGDFCFGTLVGGASFALTFGLVVMFDGSCSIHFIDGSFF